MLECVLFKRWGARRRVLGLPQHAARTRSRSRPEARRNRFSPGDGRPGPAGACSSRGGTSASSRRRSRPASVTLVWRLSGQHGDRLRRLAGLQPDASSSGRSPSRPTTRASSSSGSTARSSRPAATGRRAVRSGPGIGEGTVSETAGAGDEPRGLRLEGRVHAERRRRGLRARDEGRRRGRRAATSSSARSRTRGRARRRSRRHRRRHRPRRHHRRRRPTDTTDPAAAGAAAAARPARRCSTSSSRRPSSRRRSSSAAGSRGR